MAKARFEEDLIFKLTPSGENSVFSYISSLCKGGSIPSAVFYDSVSASTVDERVTLFNVYFNSVFTRSSFLLRIFLLLIPFYPPLIFLWMMFLTVFLHWMLLKQSGL